MADTSHYESVEWVGLHEPDYSDEVGPNGEKLRIELPGFFTVGLMFGGAFQPVYRFKAGNVLNADGSHVTPAADQGTQDATEQPQPAEQPTQPQDAPQQ